jgi:hypothetical protein
MIGRKSPLRHSLEEWIERLGVMKDLVITAHRMRNQYSELAEETYDEDEIKHMLEQVQSMALGIASEKITHIKTDMDSWKED